VLRLTTIIGARPQFIKAAAISRVLKNEPDFEEIIVHTGQHYDQNMSDIFFEELQIPIPNYNLNIGSGSHAEQTGHMLISIEKLLLKEHPDAVIIYGDTNSTIAGVLAAAKLHIPIAHVEAGLRSFNKKMPEEVNRIVADHLSDFLYVPTVTAMKHLQREGLSDKAILSGDVMMDSILFYKELINKNPSKYHINEVENNYSVVTIHRPVNTDNIANLKNIFKAIHQIEELFVFPAHPRVKKIIHDNSIDIPQNVRMIPPVGYLQMIKLLLGTQKVYTDSGGLQKEAYILRKPCITLREETEWVETLNNGWNTTVGANSERIVATSKLKVSDQEPEPYYGDGHAAEFIIEHLKKNLL